MADEVCCRQCGLSIDRHVNINPDKDVRDRVVMLNPDAKVRVTISKIGRPSWFSGLRTV